MAVSLLKGSLFFSTSGVRCCLFLLSGGSITIALGEKHKPSSEKHWLRDNCHIESEEKRWSSARGSLFFFYSIFCSILRRTVYSAGEDGKQREAVIRDEGQEWKPKCSKKRWRCPRLYETVSALEGMYWIFEHRVQYSILNMLSE